MEKASFYKKKFEILQEISNAIVISDNIHTIANLLLDMAINYTNAEKGSLMWVNERNEMTVLASRGLDIPPDMRTAVKMGEGVAGTVAKTHKPLLVEDIDKESGLKKDQRKRYKTKSFISCPIIINKKLLGILNINDKKDGTCFNADEFELLQTLANHAAIAIENAMLLSQVKIKALELEEINKKLMESDIVKTEFITRLSHELRTPLNSVKGAIYFLQNSSKISREEEAEFQGIISVETDKLVSIVENLLTFLRVEDEARIIKKSLLNSEEIFKELLSSSSLSATLSRKGISFTVNHFSSPIEFVGDRIKVLQLFTNLVAGFSHYLERGDEINITGREEKDIKFTILLKRPLPDDAMSILRDHRYVFHIDHPEDRLKLYLARNIIESHHWNISAENAENRCTVVVSIPKSAQETRNIYLDHAIDSFVELIAKLLDVDICSMMLCDNLTNELTMKSAVGLDEDIIKRTRIKFGDKIAGWVALEGKPLFIEDIENDERFGKINVSQYTTKSLMTLPLKSGDRVIGVLNLNNKKSSEPFSKVDYELASHLTEKISRFVEMLHSENYIEQDFEQCLKSLEHILESNPGHQIKKTVLLEFMDKMFNRSSPLTKLKKLPRV